MFYFFGRRLSLAAVGGSGSNGRIREVGRQSAIGTKQKVMQDKAYQKEVERELVEFCGAHGYPNINLSSSSFPLSSTEFKQMFAFLVRFLIPDFPDLVSGFESTVSGDPCSFLLLLFFATGFIFTHFFGGF